MRTLARFSVLAIGCTLSSAVFGALAGCAFFTHACPFCTQTSKTLSEEIAAADATIIAKIVEAPAEQGDSVGGALPMAKFEVMKVIKGTDHLDGAKQVEAYYFGEFKADARFLLTGMVLPNLEWSTPIPLSDRGHAYVGQLQTLPEAGPERLAFFQEYLEDSDPLMGRDAYDEFARTPYADVIGLKDRMNHDRLIGWIKDQETSPSHRRLYLTMLGICGTDADLAMLEEMLRSKDRKDKQALDAMIACYLTLKGPDGMPMVEDLFLKNHEAEYADTYAAIMAIRFHGEETETIPRPRLIEALHCMLDRPKLADLVISDLSRWEDWGVMDRLVKLFEDADAKNNWVRVPVINYLQVARDADGEVGAKAKALIDELAKIDPKAVQQAEAYGAFGLLAATKDPPPGSSRPKSAVKPPVSGDKAAAAAANEDPAPKLDPPKPRIAEEPVAEQAAEPIATGEKKLSAREEVEEVNSAPPAIGDSDEDASAEAEPTDERKVSSAPDHLQIDSWHPAAGSAARPIVERESGSTGLGTGVAVGIVIVFVTMIFSIGSGRP